MLLGLLLLAVRALIERARGLLRRALIELRLSTLWVEHRVAFVFDFSCIRTDGSVVGRNELVDVLVVVNAEHDLA